MHSFLFQVSWPVGISLFWLRISYIVLDPLFSFINGCTWDGINGFFVLCVIFIFMSFRYALIAFMVP